MRREDRQAAFGIGALLLLGISLALLLLPTGDGCRWGLAAALGGDDPCREAAAGRVATGLLLFPPGTACFALYLVDLVRGRDGD